MSNKTYAFGEKTDTEIKFETEDNELRKKWKKDYDSGILKLGNTLFRGGPKKNYENKNRMVKLDEDNNPIITEKCMKCNEILILSPLYFNIEFKNSGIDNINKKSGMEQFCNTPSYGCRDCSKKMAVDKSKNKNEYIRILLKPYKKLNKEWYNKIPNICSISNLPLNEQHNVEWSVSIQNNNKLNKEHLPEYCCKIAYEFNVQEQNAIPDLIECWKLVFISFSQELINPTNTIELIEEIKQWWNNTPIQNGVNAPTQINKNNKKITNPEYSSQMQKKHLPCILGDLRSRYIKNDKRSKRDPEKAGECLLTITELYNKLIEQKGKCYYTDIPFSLKRDTWNYFSLERIDNSKNHTYDNTKFICRIFNTAGQLNRSKIIKALLSQKLVEISNEVKEKTMFLSF